MMTAHVRHSGHCRVTDRFGTRYSSNLPFVYGDKLIDFCTISHPAVAWRCKPCVSHRSAHSPHCAHRGCLFAGAPVQRGTIRHMKRRHSLSRLTQSKRACHF